MRTGVQKPKSIQQTTSTGTTLSARANVEQSRELKPNLHSQFTTESQLASPASPFFAHDFSQIPLLQSVADNIIQPKLKIGAPNDKYEQEADRVADQIMRMPGPRTVQTRNSLPQIQRKCQECEDELQRKSTQTTTQTQPAPLYSSASSGNSLIQPFHHGGFPLSKTDRNFYEPRIGMDFSQVRIHTGPRASEAAQSIQARAFTYRNNIVFGAGQYQPTAHEGKRLMAHELTHVVQQSTAPSVVRRGIMHDSMPVVRRAPATPQKVGTKHSRKGELPLQQRGKEQVRLEVVRTLEECPCREVTFKKEGLFYDAQLKNLALAYRYCIGGVTTDVYATLQTNAKAFLEGKEPPKGTARVGIDINIWAHTQGGRIVVEAIGTNEGGGKGIGGRAQLIYQRKKWRIVLEPQFLRRLKNLPGASTKNELQLKLGGQIGDVTIRLNALNLLDKFKRGGGGEFCYKLTDNLNLCASFMVTKVPGRRIPEYKGQVGVKGRIPLPEVEKPICRNCYCPGPVKTYKCYETPIPHKKKTPQKPKEKDFRYYFKYNSSEKSEEDFLRAESARNVSSVAQQVRKGGRIEDIIGYASPEATEKYNLGLSAKRARKMRTILQTTIGTDVMLPNPTAGGELLGRTATQAPSSRLVGIINQAGFHSAEELSKKLAGHHIPDPKLAAQFIALFQAIPNDADRLTLFGLSPGHKMAKQVLGLIDEFVKGGGKGRRPWERVFRLLRIAVIRAELAVPKEKKDKNPAAPKAKEIKGDKCKQYADDAEKRNLFGIVDPSAKRNIKTEYENNSDCHLKPTKEDLARGCKYEKPAKPPKSRGMSKGQTTRSPELEAELRRRKAEELKGPKIAPHPLKMR